MVAHSHSYECGQWRPEEEKGKRESFFDTLWDTWPSERALKQVQRSGAGGFEIE